MFSGSPGAYLRQVLVDWCLSQWFWTFLMGFTGLWWIGCFGFAFTAVVHFVVTLDAALQPRYRRRRVEKPPDKSRRLSGKKWRKLRRSIAKYRSEALKWKRKMQEQEDLDEFLDGKDSAFDEFGRHYQREYADWYINTCVRVFMADFFPDSPDDSSASAPKTWEEPVPNWVFYEDCKKEPTPVPVVEDDDDGFLCEAPLPFALYQIDRALLHHFTTVDLPDPTGIMKFVRGLPLYKHEENIRYAIRRASYHLRFCEAKFKDISLSHLDKDDFTSGRTEAFYRTPGIMDSGASFGLTPFIEDFITYQEVDITVKDVSSTNRVVGMGTVLYRIRATNGDWCWLPSLAYHLPTTDIRLISPQAYHQQYGGRSIITGDVFAMHLKKPVGEGFVPHVLRIPIDPGTNLPMVFDLACTVKEQQEIGPLFRGSISFLQQHEGFFFGTWNPTRLETEDHEFLSEVDYEFSPFLHNSMFHECVTSDANRNLSNAQKEVLLWHAKLNCSMAKVQYLMTGHSREDASGQSTWYPPVIHPKHASAASCSKPMCATCEMAKAKVKKPKSVKQHVVKEQEHLMSKGNYKPGDFVSMDTVIVPIPGRLFSGNGGDYAPEKYTCATIFHDAGSGVIKVYPQLSASASDTLLSKAKFEDFLWTEAGVRVRHYHSDQGVFASNEFRENCKGRRQDQTFSGASAKFQNSLAERSVQTVFWMARHMMLHAALRWATNGADDPRLWPQAVKYSEYLFNRTPSLGSGFSPLERLTQRRSDHKDLLRCHVWGAPVYVLDPRLGDGKKIPKFAQRARCAQFLGFSDEHSSTVGLVRHLVTGNISAQYHVVYDDRFETVFGLFGLQEDDEKLDNLVETIWTKLFTSDGARDCYVDPEYDASTDELIYDVPPLEEYFLDEDDLRDREERLQEQIVRVKQQQTQYEDHFPKFAADTPSQKVKIRFKDDPDVLDDDTSSVSSDVPLQDYFPGPSEGEVDTSSSREQKEPLPSVLKSPSIEQKETVEIGEVEVEETDWSKRRLRPKRSSWKDRVYISAKSWRMALDYTPYQLAALTSAEKKILRRYDSHFGHYQLTLSGFTTPTEVRRLDSKKLRNRQKWTRRRESAEQAFRAMNLNISTVEDLLASPLSQYITLASNDCIYSGSRTTLVCQDIHPFFLSAKTGISAEDNPNWGEAMSGPEAEKYWEAAKIEIATLEGMKAWDVVDKSSVPKGKRILPSLWVFKRKRNPDGTVRKYKGRLTVRGDHQIAGVDFTETWAPVCAWSTVRLLFNLQCCLGLKSVSADVECAFLNAPLDEGEEVYVQMPQGFQQEGKCLKLRQSLYGLRQSPRNFWKYLTKVMQDCGMEQSDHDPCLFIGEKVIAVAYVDDILFWSRDENDITELMVTLRGAGLMLEKEKHVFEYLRKKLCGW
jgi:hypothetical protein